MALCIPPLALAGQRVSACLSLKSTSDACFALQKHSELKQSASLFYKVTTFWSQAEPAFDRIFQQKPGLERVHPAQ